MQKEARRGTEVGHDHSDRLGPEMDLGEQEVRDECHLDRGRLTRLVRFQEVEESGEARVRQRMVPGVQRR